MKKIVFIILIFLLMPLILARPIYSVDAWINNPSSNPGEILEVKASIMGEGNIIDNRIKASSDGKVFFVIGENEHSGSMHTKIDEYYFQTKKEGRSYAEWGAPFQFNITSEKSGDHRLLISFLYSDEEGQYYLSEREFVFHINTWQERNNFWLQPSLIFLAILALFFGGSYNEEIKKWVKKKFRF